MTRSTPSDASTGQLIGQATEDISVLVRDEIELAKRDLAQSGKRLGAGVGLFGFASTLGLYGLGALVAAAILAIAQAVDPWLAALIVAASLFVTAGLAALVGKNRVGQIAEPPKERVGSVRADVAAVRHGSDGGPA